ncbi:stage III sporulation protein AH [Caldanaerobacter subterraneus subsp. tengcongensis MB4]|uniref:Stage III sporulation protein AH n=2 Tax=Caldanaerobacter subterraneus TaxID=911092 RepID=Q8RAD3_CALS4|nr:SpoIIIAH-like family protein [Caldanaerobacter subterraneus]AAM24514.1 stage III sporulation protein AH [Caldanaerobacter subterraneus subsp. tengcongensis MB4]MCS3915924.1 stage III sporulation protein AH [Caldanaerobacter subterraneus subsp. tengcongensis MB4]MDK2794329.1 stage sporulation protein [Caldanaerobacter sp.]NNG66776.1 SpoIIIAH-like family protein [Caldanaerobacter subterraneus]
MVYMRKRLIAIVSLILLIAIAFVLNYGYTEKKVDNAKNSSTQEVSQKAVETSAYTQGKYVASGIFTAYREEREINRSRSIDALKEIVENKNTSQATRDEAQKQIIKLTEITNQEMIIENLIKAKGFQDAVVMIDNGIVNVIVQADKLSEEEVAQIVEIVSRQTGVSLDNIKIMTRLD